jgi:hypothetical protein
MARPKKKALNCLVSKIPQISSDNGMFSMSGVQFNFTTCSVVNFEYGGMGNYFGGRKKPKMSLKFVSVQLGRPEKIFKLSKLINAKSKKDIHHILGRIQCNFRHCTEIHRIHRNLKVQNRFGRPFQYPKVHQQSSCICYEKLEV